jgi:hypothetical protein
VLASTIIELRTKEEKMEKQGQKDLNKGKGIHPDSEMNKQGKHTAPGRSTGDNLSTGGRTTGGAQNTGRGFDREDREREQPGSKQVDREKNY